MSEDQEIIEKNPIVTLCISSAQGVLNIQQIGGYTLSKLLIELASIEDIPLRQQDKQIDLVGQEIFVTNNVDFVSGISSAFTHLSWKAILEFKRTCRLSEHTYSFVISY
jgi:hypothetical protein